MFKLDIRIIKVKEYMILKEFDQKQNSKKYIYYIFVNLYYSILNIFN